jgi:hypothetical protein
MWQHFYYIVGLNLILEITYTAEISHNFLQSHQGNAGIVPQKETMTIFCLIAHNHIDIQYYTTSFVDKALLNKLRNK